MFLNDNDKDKMSLRCLYEGLFTQMQLRYHLLSYIIRDTCAIIVKSLKRSLHSKNKIQIFSINNYM